MTQTKAEKVALNAAWLEDPRVAALREDLRATARAAGWRWDAAGLSAALSHAIAHQRHAGALPESGVLCE